MKKFFIVLAALVFVGMFASVTMAKDMKIGYVNAMQVLNEYKKTKEYEDALTKKAEGKEKELDAKRSEIEKSISKANLLKDKEKEKEDQKITQAKKDFQQAYTQARADLTKERNEKMKEIAEDIDRVVKEYATKNNFDFVLNEGAVLYGSKTMDVTVDILKILNESKKK